MTPPRIMSLRSYLPWTLLLLMAVYAVAQAPGASLDPQIPKHDTQLGTNLEELALRLAHISSPSAEKHAYPPLQSLNLTAMQTNFSKVNGAQDDYLVQLDAETGWKNHATVILAFIAENGTYRKAFGVVVTNKGFGQRAELVGIDSDNRMELLLAHDASGNQSTWNKWGQ